MRAGETCGLLAGVIEAGSWQGVELVREVYIFMVTGWQACADRSRGGCDEGRSGTPVVDSLISFAAQTRSRGCTVTNMPRYAIDETAAPAGGVAGADTVKTWLGRAGEGGGAAKRIGTA